MGTLGSVNQTNLTDSSGLATGATYYYRVFVVDTNEAYAASNEGSCTLLPLVYPFADGMANLDQWITTGNWGLTTSTAHSGPASLTDSPAGNYGPYADSLAQTAVDLSRASWPVLRFWDRYAMDGNTRALVVVNGQPVYEASGTQQDWSPHAVDLSPWAGLPNVQISFRLWNRSGGTADGWYVDDVSVSEEPVATLGYPFFEDFENGVSQWLPGNWSLSGSQPDTGTNAVHNKVADIWYNDTGLGTPNMLLTPAGEFDLAGAVNPQLVFWWRGYVNPYGSGTFWVQVYRAGLGWQPLWDNGSAGYNGTYDWTRAQVSLTNYVGTRIRLRVYMSGNPDIYIDHFGVGGLEPGAPTFVGPAQTGFVPVLRPTLVVGNAVQAEDLPLTYQFEVYSDPGLTNLVAQVPALASGASTTAWTVDINLANHASYWWRCRAAYLTNAGPWMATATFLVNQGGSPPNPPVVAWPLNGTILPSMDSPLTWYPAIDPDPYDVIAAYRLQVDSTPAFGSPVIDVTIPMNGPVTVNNWPWVTISAPVGDFAGVTNLVAGTNYYWRVQSVDSHFNPSGWSTETGSFVFLHLPPPVITSLQPAPDGSMLLSWEATTNKLYVEFTPSLTPPVTWSAVAGPLSGSGGLVPVATNSPSGFYRLRRE